MMNATSETGTIYTSRTQVQQLTNPFVWGLCCSISNEIITAKTVIFFFRST